MLPTVREGKIISGRQAISGERASPDILGDSDGSLRPCDLSSLPPGSSSSPPGLSSEEKRLTERERGMQGRVKGGVRDPHAQSGCSQILYYFIDIATL